MPDVAFTVNGRRYEVSCNPGEEAHLADLADYLDKRVSGLAAQLGQIGEMRLVIMGSLLVADELSEALDKLERKDAELAHLKTALEQRERALAEALTRAADRAEAVAARLEAP
jgi:cell division protein ZapA